MSGAGRKLLRAEGPAATHTETPLGALPGQSYPGSPPTPSVARPLPGWGTRGASLVVAGAAAAAGLDRPGAGPSCRPWETRKTKTDSALEHPKARCCGLGWSWSQGWQRRWETSRRVKGQERDRERGCPQGWGADSLSPGPWTQETQETQDPAQSSLGA